MSTDTHTNSLWILLTDIFKSWSHTHHLSLIRIAGVVKQNTSSALQMYSYKSRMLNDVEQHHLILIRWKWIFFVKNPRFWNPAREKSDGLPLLPHAFDNVRGLHHASFLLIVMIKLAFNRACSMDSRKQFDKDHISCGNSVRCIFFPL